MSNRLILAILALLLAIAPVASQNSLSDWEAIIEAIEDNSSISSSRRTSIRNLILGLLANELPIPAWNGSAFALGSDCFTVWGAPNGICMSATDVSNILGELSGSGQLSATHRPRILQIVRDAIQYRIQRGWTVSGNTITTSAGLDTPGGSFQYSDQGYIRTGGDIAASQIASGTITETRLPNRQIADIDGLQTALDNAGGTEFSSANEITVSWTGLSARQALLTSLTPPTDTDAMFVSFRIEDEAAWSGGLMIDYSVWNAFSAVAAGNNLTDSNSWEYAGLDDFASTRSFHVGKGTGGVIALAVEDTTSAARRFDRFRVRWVSF